MERSLNVTYSYREVVNDAVYTDNLFQAITHRGIDYFLRQILIVLYMNCYNQFIE